VADSEDIKQLMKALNEGDLATAERLFTKIADQMGRIRRFAADTVEELEAQAKFEAELEKTVAKRLTGAESANKAAQAEVTYAEGMLEAARKRLYILQQQESVSAEMLVQATEAAIAAEEELDTRRKHVRALEDARSAGQNLAASLFGISTTSNQIFETWKKMGSKGVIANFNKGINEALNPIGLLKAGMDKIVESTLAGYKGLDEFYTSAARSSQISQEMAAHIFDLDAGMAGLGIDSAELSSAFDQSFNSMSQFSLMSEGVQTELYQTAAQFDQAMGSAGDFITAMDTIAKALPRTEEGFMNVEESIRLAEDEIVGFGISIGISGQQAINMFNRVGPRLAQFGDNGIEQFQELAKQARALGIEIDSLTAGAEQFDTFEGAAQAAGSLNAILGGAFIDPLTMSMTDDYSERIQLLHQAFQDSNRNIAESPKLIRALASELNFTQEEIVAIANGNLELAENLNATGLAGDMAFNGMADAAERGSTSLEKVEASIKRTNEEAAQNTFEMYEATLDKVTDILNRFSTVQIVGALTVLGLALKGGTHLLEKKFGATGQLKEGMTDLSKTLESLDKTMGDLAATMNQSMAPALDALTEAEQNLGDATSETNSELDAQQGALAETGGTASVTTPEIDGLAEAEIEMGEATDIATDSKHKLADGFGAAAAAAGAGFGAFQMTEEILGLLPGPARVVVGALAALAGAAAAFYIAMSGPLSPATAMTIAGAVGVAAAGIKSTLSGMDAFETGTDSLTGEPFLAGESATASGEVVASAKPYKGGAVINNANVVAGMAALSNVGTSASPMSSTGGGGGPAATSKPTYAAGGERVVVLEVDGRQFGKAVLKAFEDDPRLKTLFSSR